MRSWTQALCEETAMPMRPRDKTVFRGPSALAIKRFAVERPRLATRAHSRTDMTTSTVSPRSTIVLRPSAAFWVIVGMV